MFFYKQVERRGKGKHHDRDGQQEQHENEDEKWIEEVDDPFDVQVVELGYGFRHMGNHVEEPFQPSHVLICLFKSKPTLTYTHTHSHTNKRLNQGKY